ncbi:hypothetical protein ACNO5E_14230 [Vibrio parahaemolyticus]
MAKAKLYSFTDHSNADPESWEGIWTELQKGNDIHTRVQIALAYQPCYENERLHISDGWHRVALYIKAGRKTIPAIVGIPINHKTSYSLVVFS